MIYPDIPIMNSLLDEKNREIFLERIKRAKGERIWIALDRYTFFDIERRRCALMKLKENLEFFEKNGYEVGVWFQAFGFGDALPYSECSWTRIRSISGVTLEIDALCPEDSEFMSAYIDWVKDIAAINPKLMMLDDDLCLSVRPGIGCFCDKHMKLLENEIGEPFELTRIFTGEKNKYRDAFYKVMGDSMRNFCRKVRKAVDEINPAICIGLCAGYTSWDIEGTDPIEMSKILAGSNNIPFFRLTSAPYWVKKTEQRFNGQRLSAVIENARNQIEWCKDSGVEFFAEADSWPKTCYSTPAMLVENFDIVMHAAGIKSLKYLFNYISSTEYEKQYWKIHTKNLPLYDTIEKAFENSKFCGVRVYRPMHRITDAILPDKYIGDFDVMRTYFSSAAAMLACHAIPICYGDKSDYAVVFGDDAIYFENIHKKVVLDLPAALILKEKGIDIGIRSVREAPSPSLELYENEKVQIQWTSPKAKFKSIDLENGAVLISKYDTGEVASFEYGKFLILNFDAFEVNEGSVLFSSYERGRQINEFFCNPYPAIYGYSELYSVCAERENSHISLFQNHSIDPVFDFDIVLPKEIKNFQLYGANGELEGNRIHINSDFNPQSTIILEVEYNT